MRSLCVWLLLVILFDGTTYLGIRVALQPPPVAAVGAAPTFEQSGETSRSERPVACTATNIETLIMQAHDDDIADLCSRSVPSRTPPP